MNARGPKGSRRSLSDADQHLFNSTYESSAAQDKLWNYVKGVVETPEVRERIKLIRKEYKIPQTGLKKSSKDYDPRILFDIDSMRQDLELDVQWILAIANYVIYNKWEWFSSFGGLLEISEHGNGVRPISINISPYASQRDIIDFVAKTYESEIHPMQAKFRKGQIRIGRINKRDEEKAQIRKYIYENRTIGKKKLAEAIRLKFSKVMEYNYIGKIIRDERKKRK